MSDKKDILIWVDSKEAEYLKALILNDIKKCLININVEGKVLLAARLIEQVAKEKPKAEVTE